MKCLFNVKNLKIDKNGKFVIELTEEERIKIKRTKEELQNIEIVPEFREDFEKVIPAIALMHHAYSLVRGFLKEGEKSYMERAITAISKAYLIYPLPIYLYDLGRFFEYNGDYNSAKQSYMDYIESEKSYTPGRFDEMLIKDHDINFIMNDAKERIKKIERGESEK